MRMTTAQLVPCLVVLSLSISGSAAWQSTPNSQRSVHRFSSTKNNAYQSSRTQLQRTPQDQQWAERSEHWAERSEHCDQTMMKNSLARRHFLNSAIAAFSAVALSASPAFADGAPAPAAPKPPAPAPAPAAPKAPDGAPAPAAPKPPAPAAAPPTPPAPAPAPAAPKPPAPAPSPAPAPAPAATKPPAPKPAAPTSAFAGTYTDPNHPGGKVSIKPTGQSVGDYRLAEVVGGGGKDEPATYTLPAVIMGERTIFIDFTGKGGPKNFVGFLNKDGDVDFLKDGNRWSRVD